MLHPAPLCLSSLRRAAPLCLSSLRRAPAFAAPLAPLLILWPLWVRLAAKVWTQKHAKE